MRVIELLDKSAVNYGITEHSPAFTAQQMAAAEHEPGKYVAKPVIVKADGKYIMCVLSACCKIDLGALKSQVGAESVELAREDEIGAIFDDCELGAEPPFGNLYDLLLSVRDGTALQKDACAESIRGLHRYTTRAWLGVPRAAVRQGSGTGTYRDMFLPVGLAVPPSASARVC